MEGRRLRPILVMGALGSLAAGLAGGLVRIGWPALPAPARSVAGHGPLMVIGFLATLIGLERAVALRLRFVYGAPALTAAAGLAVLVPGAQRVSAVAAAAGSGLLASALVGEAVRRRLAPAITIAAGSVLLAAGCVAWAAGAPLPRVFPSWGAFLVLTIAGERLELARLRPARRGAEARFGLLAAATGLAGLLALAPALHATATRLGGLSSLGLALWLLRHDLARRSAQRPGLARFMALSLLAGYGWLAVAGAAAAVLGAATAGPAYDLFVHALFLGFGFSMIFGHAPVVFPALLGLPIRFRARFYVHMGLLHAGVALRLAGDLAGRSPLRVAGGVLAALAIVLFLIQTAGSLGPLGGAPTARR